MPALDVHGDSLATSTWLSGLYVTSMIPPLDVITVLEAANIKYVLVGAHGIGGWTKRPRATQDVDVIVAARQVKKATRVLLAAFPSLEVQETEHVVRLGHAQSPRHVIDIIKPVEAVIRAVLRNRSVVHLECRPYHVPTLEMALALKYAPLLRLTRSQAKKHLDAGEFISMINSNPTIDEAKLAELGDLIYNGGGKELVEMVAKVRRGEKLYF